MKKSVSELTENDVIHAETRQQAIELCKLFDSLELKWISGLTYLEENHWDKYKEKTCYNPIKGGYGHLILLKKDGDKIHKATDFINIDKFKSE